MQKPTIGRMVIYKDDEGCEWPATIVMTEYTWKDRPHPFKPPVLDSTEHAHLHVNVLYRGIVERYNVPRGAENGMWRWPVIP